MAKAKGKQPAGRKKSPKRKQSPKRKKSPGRKKSGKMSSKTRAQKEEEKALQEAEELRLKAEQEEKEKLEVEEKVRKEIELNERLVELRESEGPQTQAEFDMLDKIHELPEDYVKPDPDWLRYIKCDRKPDPTQKAQINTFITMTKEDINTNMDHILAESLLILELIDQLNAILKDPGQIVRDQIKAQHQQTITMLEDLLMMRYNQATMKVLMDATDKADSDTGNLQQVINGENEVVFIWGNLNKNPRFKTFEFKFEFMQFEIPKILAISDVAVIEPEPEEDFPPEGTSADEEPKEIAGSDVLGETSSLAVPVKVSSAISIASTRSSSSRAESKRGLKSRKGKKAASKANLRKTIKDDAENAEKDSAMLTSLLNSELEESANTGIDIDLRIYTRLGAIYHLSLLEMPPQPKVIKGWTIRQLIERPLTEFPFSAKLSNARAGSRNGTTAPAASSSPNPPLNSIAENESLERSSLVKLSSTSKPPNQDSSRELPSNSNKTQTPDRSSTVMESRSNEPTSPTNGTPERNSTEIQQTLNDLQDSGSNKISTATQQSSNEPLNLIGVSFKLPDDVMFLEKPQVAIWDKQNRRWNTGGISDVQTYPIRIIAFKTSEPGIYGLFQKTYLNIPFRSWEMKPKAENSCCLTITGAMTEIEFIFEEQKCQIKHPGASAPTEILHLLDKWFTVEEIIDELQKTGLNFFPPEDASIILEIKPKGLDLDRIYRQMAILSSAYAFSWCKWNSYASNNQIVLKVAPFYVDGGEHDLDSVPDEDWNNYLIASDRCYKLDLPYYGHEFNDAIHTNAEHHCDLLHSLRLTPLLLDFEYEHLAAVFQRSRTVDPYFVDSVYKMLKAVNPITFS